MKTDQLRADARTAYVEVDTYLSDNREILDKALSLVEELLPTHHVTLSNDIDISASGDRHALLALWKGFRALGLEPGSRPEKNAEVISAHWYQNFRKAGEVRLFWLYFSSTECRRVQTGTKMIEQPIFEVVCGEWL